MAAKNKTTVIQLFIDKNSLKKKELAEYLGVSAAFITQIAQGFRDIPDDKLALIKANQEWDTSMFNENEVLKNDSENYGSNSDFSAMLELVKSQQRTIENLSDTVKNLTNK